MVVTHSIYIVIKAMMDVEQDSGSDRTVSMESRVLAAIDEGDEFSARSMLVGWAQSLDVDWAGPGDTRGTLLRRASRFGLRAVVGILLRLGANANLRDCEGLPPLMLACTHQDANACEVVDVLLRSGADPSIKTTSGEDALAWAVSAKRPEVSLVISEFAERFSLTAEMFERASELTKCLDVRETLLERGLGIELALGPSAPQIYLKREDLQRSGSFKYRGAAHALLTLAEQARRDESNSITIVSASTGNHGRALCEAALLLRGRYPNWQIHLKLFVPVNVEASKMARLNYYQEQGAVELVRQGKDAEETETAARNNATLIPGAKFISPYNDLDIILGQGTCGVELAKQMPNLDAVFVSVGGGGLISGIAAYLKRRAFQAGAKVPKIIGAQPANSAVMVASVAKKCIANEVVSLPTLSDGTAGGIEEGAVTLDYNMRYVDEYECVSETEIAQSMRMLIDCQGTCVEGAAGVALAAFIKQYRAGRWTAQSKVAVVLCGRNIGFTKFLKAMLLDK